MSLTADHSLSTNKRIEELELAVSEIKASLSSIQRTLLDFQGLLRQNAEGMDQVMEITQALSEVITGGQPNAIE